MINLDDLVELLEDTRGTGEVVTITLTAKNVTALLDELSGIRERLADIRTLMDAQRKATVSANRIFKRANKWPAYQYPDLSTLIDWLMDYYSRRQAVKFQVAVEEILQKLNSLGMVGLDQPVVVPGRLIISLRSKLDNTLHTAYDQNTAFLFDEQKPGTIHSAEEDEIRNE